MTVELPLAEVNDDKDNTVMMPVNNSSTIVESYEQYTPPGISPSHIGIHQSIGKKWMEY